MDRYMETWNIGNNGELFTLILVSRAYVARVTKESSSSDITTGGVSY